jgi:hypothetical protein
MQTRTIRFTKERDTKNTVKFEEQPAPGNPPVIGSLYVQKWAAGGLTELTITLSLPQPKPAARFDG